MGCFGRLGGGAKRAEKKKIREDNIMQMPPKVGADPAWLGGQKAAGRASNAIARAAASTGREEESG